MRLFIAIPLAASLKEPLQDLQQSLPSGIRRQPARQMHITLRFLGETSSEKAKQLNNKLADISKAVFPLDIQGVGTFPQKAKPKVIWTGTNTSQPLIQLQQKIEKVCVAVGFKPERRDYIPHITLGRVKNANQQEVKCWIKQNKQQFIARLSVRQFVLFESRQKRNGVVHKAVKYFNF